MTITTEKAEECARGQDAIKESSQLPGYRSIAERAGATIRSLAAERDALQKRVAELEAQNEMLRHATDKLRAMLTELNARHEPLQRAFITAVELLNDAALEGGKDE